MCACVHARMRDTKCLIQEKMSLSQTTAYLKALHQYRACYIRQYGCGELYARVAIHEKLKFLQIIRLKLEV